MVGLDCGYELILCHSGYHPANGACGKHTQGCQPAGVFEDLGELREKRIEQPFYEVGYPGPFLDQSLVGIVRGPKFCVGTLRDDTLNKLPGTQELRRYFTVPIVILPAIDIIPVSASTYIG